MDDWIQGKHFSITDAKDVNTVIYQVNEENKKDSNFKFSIERLDYTEEILGEKKRKTFYVNQPDPDGNDLILLSFGPEKVVVNLGLLELDKVSIIKKPIPIKYQTLYSEEEFEYREFEYTPNLKRQISIIDPETTEEIKPILYFDEETNQVKGKCKLKPYKSYFAFEIKED